MLTSEVSRVPACMLQNIYEAALTFAQRTVKVQAPFSGSIFHPKSSTLRRKICLHALRDASFGPSFTIPQLSILQVSEAELRRQKKARRRGVHLQASSYNPYPTSLATKAGKLARAALNGVNMVLRFILSIPLRLRGFAALSSAQRRDVYKGWWVTIKKEAHHYWVRIPRTKSQHLSSLLRGRSIIQTLGCRNGSKKNLMYLLGME